jgi:hypothetical protein
MLEVLGLAVAIAAAYFAWRANQKSDDANEIARSALAISESEYADRRREHAARAALTVSIGVVDRENDSDGILRLGGSHGNLQLVFLVGNNGDRDAGRGRIEVTFPATHSDPSIRWTDPNGRELPQHPERAARIGETNLLTRALDGVSRDVDETLYARLPVLIPSGEDVNDYPIHARVVAEGADGDAVADFVLRTGSNPML